MKTANRILIIFTLLSLPIFCPAQTIHEAAESGNFELVKKLVAQNSDRLNSTDGPQGRTPLHCAIRGKKYEIAMWLIDLGADVNAKDQNGASVLNYASYWGLKDIVILLMNKGAVVKEDISKYKYTPLQMAVMGNNVDIAKILIDNGVVANSEAGVPSILIATGRQYLEMTKLLLDSGADPNTRHPLNNNTSLHSAAAAGNVELIKLFLSAGADVSLKNNQGKSALRIATDCGQINAFDSLLNPKNIDINETDTEFGMTLLHAAAICGSTGIIQLLIRRGANVSAKDYAGNTPLYYAAKYGHKSSADLLVSAGASSDKLIENYGYSKVLHNELKDREAHIWYLGHCGWAVKTRTKLLIFDYWNYDVEPTEPVLANGHINTEEISGLDVYVFVSHAHYDHFDKIILEWEKSVPEIKYIFGWDEYEDKYTNFNWTRGTKIIDDVEITYINSDLDKEGAFFVSVDGLKIYHGGDYYFSETDSGNLKFLEDNYVKADIAFIECGFENIAETTIYALNPSVMFSMHFRHAEQRYKDFASKVGNKYPGTQFISTENRGDNFHYHNGKMGKE